jgi:hypothetical protein
MKSLLVALLAISAIACSRQNTLGELPVATSAQQDADSSTMETDAHVLNPNQEATTPYNGKATTYKFAQTIWNECDDVVTANYNGYKCAQSRNISSMLKSFIDKHMYKCVDAGLAAQGGGKTSEFHIVHNGITGDPEHSPKSLHAENRAIDIKTIKVKLTSGSQKEFVYEGTTNREFYKAFRKCWGTVVATYNGCPYVSGGVSQTGSIGWENADHQHHLHTSIPYCVAGDYGSGYYER